MSSGNGSTNSIKGTIARMHATFGFITGEDGVERFFIPSAMQRTCETPFDKLTAGMRVQFMPIEAPKGPRAIEIRVL